MCVYINYIISILFFNSFIILPIGTHLKLVYICKVLCNSQYFAKEKLM